MHLFVDTNIYLSFYHFTNDDLEILQKLTECVQHQQIVLHLPQHVLNEWERNREVKLNLAISEVKKIQFQLSLPRHMSGLDMAKLYIESIVQAKKARDHLVAEATAKARTYGLEVDGLLKSLFAAATVHAEDDAIFARAKLRADKGNPPGKQGSIGDQYNWEILLAQVPNANLYVVTKDGDYKSALEGPAGNGLSFPNSVLQREWQSAKQASLSIFGSIKEFLVHHDKIVAEEAANAAIERAATEAPAAEAGQPEVAVLAEPGAAASEPEAAAAEPAEAENEGVEFLIEPDERARPLNLELADESLEPEERQEKNQAVSALVNSRSFVSTHNAISQLIPYMQFLTIDDSNRLAAALAANRQISLIASDNDVNDFYLRLLATRISVLNQQNLERVLTALGLSPESEFEYSEPVN